MLTLTVWCESVSIHYEVLLWLALPWKKNKNKTPDTWLTFPAYNKLYTVLALPWKTTTTDTWLTFPAYNKLYTVLALPWKTTTTDTWLTFPAYNKLYTVLALPWKTTTTDTWLTFPAYNKLYTVLALPWKTTTTDTWLTFPAYNKLYTVLLTGWSVVLYTSWLYSVRFQSVVLVTKLLFIAFVIAFYVVSVCCTDCQAAVRCILYDFNLWYDHQAAVSSWSCSVWFQSVVLITKLPFVALMIVFCMISACGTDHRAAICCPHDCILYDFSLWYWSPSCYSLPSWLYSVWFQSVVLIPKLLFIALMIVFCMISVCGTDHQAAIHCLVLSAGQHCCPRVFWQWRTQLGSRYIIIITSKDVSYTFWENGGGGGGCIL